MSHWMEAREKLFNPGKSILHIRRWKSLDYPNNISHSYPFLGPRDISFYTVFPDASFQ